GHPAYFFLKAVARLSTLRKATEIVVNGKAKAEIKNSIGMKLVLIPAGKFTMGSPKTEQDAAFAHYKKVTKEKDSDDIVKVVLSAFRAEGPQHEVEISKPFYMGVYEVTQKQFKQVMGYNPSYFSTDGMGKEGLKYDPRFPPGGGKASLIGVDTDDFPVENV